MNGKIIKFSNSLHSTLSVKTNMIFYFKKNFNSLLLLFDQQKDINYFNDNKRAY